MPLDGLFSRKVSNIYRWEVRRGFTYPRFFLYHILADYLVIDLEKTYKTP